MPYKYIYVGAICPFLSRIFDCWHVCANGVNLAVVFSFVALDGLAGSATGQKKPIFSGWICWRILKINANF